mmetsp:Transcript_26330/g.102809  ORF Transcript_26330/g.102809 Transcript_26330/m.102809 type:complete len:99 (-) Transcript_26330:260-556(-)
MRASRGRHSPLRLENLIRFFLLSSHGMHLESAPSISRMYCTIFLKDWTVRGKLQSPLSTTKEQSGFLPWQDHGRDGPSIPLDSFSSRTPQPQTVSDFR